MGREVPDLAELVCFEDVVLVDAAVRPHRQCADVVAGHDDELVRRVAQIVNRVTIPLPSLLSLGMTFEEFAETAGRRLRAGLIAAFGPQVGVEAAADAMAYGWEHWDRVSEMNNPAGYLYRVGQTSARRAHRPSRFLPEPTPQELAEFEPRLLPALELLTEHQRVTVVLVCGFGWRQTEVADLLDISHSSVRTHQARALAKLAELLEVNRHED